MGFSYATNDVLTVGGVAQAKQSNLPKKRYFADATMDFDDIQNPQIVCQPNL